MRFLIRIVLSALLIAAGVLGGFRYAAYERETFTTSDLSLPESRFVDTVHGTLHALDTGPVEGSEDAPVVLLIHGPFGWSGVWRDSMSMLQANGYRAIALDLPPMGLSDRNDRTDFSKQAQALRIIAFVEALEVTPVLVAHSSSGAAGLEALAVAPDAFPGGVVVSGHTGIAQALNLAPLSLRPAMLREALIATSVTNPWLTKWLFQRLVYRTQSVDVGVVDTLNYPLLRDGTTEILAAWLPVFLTSSGGDGLATYTDAARLSRPVAVIWGRQDQITPPEQAVFLSDALQGAPIFWLDGAGHFPHIETADAFHNALRAALEAITEN